MLYDCRTVADRDRGIEAAIDAVKRGDLIVMPTDTLYGLGADAFKPWAVTALLDAKGRDRQMPPPLDGTVAVRMPLHPVALEVLRETGPMAVSSANKTGQPPAITAEEARAQLGFAVSVYLEAGECVDRTPSTIVDVTGDVPRLLRAGAIPLEKLRDVVPSIEGPEE
ncbi:MAG: threonylcarbamoyl-AMP synthase [Actinobacteria bacterium 13_2_20CM_2_71_6]|nr:MAG: threonylcarbamoyl-AMP synthase [Actinobacteria bacterium 13_2_20CM_2_71_6]